MEKLAAAAKRNFGLDALRAVAIAIVLANHAFIGFFIESGKAAWGGWPAGLSAVAVLSIEWLFVLSGFLIGNMMIRSFESHGSWFARARDFWLRRWFRTLPNYYLFLLVNVGIVYLGIGHGTFSWKFVLFSQNLMWPEPLPLFFGEAWSLALDEWFYLLMPILVGISAWIPKTQQRHRFLVVSLILILGSIAGRWFAPPQLEFFTWDANIRRVTIMHLDATGWGVLAAIFSRWYSTWWRRLPGVKAAAGLLVTALGAAWIAQLAVVGWAPSVYGQLKQAFVLTLPSAGVFLMLPWLSSMRCHSSAVLYVVDRISQYSYSIYLCHFPLLFVMNAIFAMDANTRLEIMLLIILLWVSLTLYLSSLVYRFFEKPVADIRERFTRRVDATPFR